MITDKQSLREILRNTFPRSRAQLLPALHFIHNEFGHLPEWAIEVVGWHLGIPASEVYGAATSYTELRIKKPGTHILRICTGLSCKINGSKELLNEVSSKLHIQPGQTTEDGKLTFEETACGFLCGMAPIIEMDHIWKGRIMPETIRQLLQEIIENE